MKSPSATYRLQLSPDFPFDELEKHLEYLEDLGISTIYAAPIFESRKGSTHGYDVVDPYTINRKIGSLGQFRRISDELKKRNMTWLQDIVPNHMAFDSDNPWLRDIFQLGENSRFYNFFDVNWSYKNWNKMMAPFLGKPLDEVIEASELKLNFGDQGFSISYYEHDYPASARSYSKILAWAEIDEWQKKFESFSGSNMDWKDLKTGFYRDVQDDPFLKSKIMRVVNLVKNTPNKMREVVQLQYFLPTYWKKTEEEINYRRFFTINDLICLRMEDQEVFDTYHYYIKELCEQGMINGLRIDHVDGLFAPGDYVEKLRKDLGEDFYIIVEKILEREENLPQRWKVQGTSGYDFLAEVNHLFTKTGNAAAFNEAYKKIFPSVPDYEDLVYEKKIFILKNRMLGELHNLMGLLQDEDLLPQKMEETRIKEALSAFLAAFPVYRIYPRTFPLNQHQRQMVSEAFETANEKEPELKEELDYLRKLFTGEAKKDEAKMLYFLQRCQQFSGPLAAKGVEDTSFYIYNRLISHNEVGDSPEHFGISVEEFHKKMLQRQKEFPLSINATATHDTKRGEDARMRLNVLSEIPEQWFEKVEEWKQLTTEIRKHVKIPGKNEEYFIYQTLLGAFPFGEVDEENFLQRTKDYLQKVLREAKVHSNWSEPDEEYENTVFEFIEDFFQNEKFRKSFDEFQRKIAGFGAIKSLAQVVVKTTAPGVPDIYQGTELWDLSYVDPDNRRPVDYDLRKSYLSDFENIEKGDLNHKLNDLCANFSSGKIKMFTLFKSLNLRKEHSETFETGEYLPIKISAKNASDFLVFARRKESKWMLIIVPANVTEFFDFEKLKPKEASLEDMKLELPDEAPKSWRNIFTDEQIEGEMNLRQLLKDFPVAILQNEK